AGTAPVLAAVGAIGHDLLDAEPSQRPHLRNQLLASLQSVNWPTGERWAGIAGKFTASGAFAVGGTKEVAYAVYNALADPESTSYAKVRSARGARASQGPEGEPNGSPPVSF